MSRPDAKKNITTLVNAFGKNTMLRELANLVLIMVRGYRAGALSVNTVKHGVASSAAPTEWFALSSTHRLPY